MRLKARLDHQCEIPPGLPDSHLYLIHLLQVLNALGAMAGVGGRQRFGGGRWRRGRRRLVRLVAGALQVRLLLVASACAAAAAGSVLVAARLRVERTVVLHVVLVHYPLLRPLAPLCEQFRS